MFRSLDPETAADALAEVEDPRIQTQLLDTVSRRSRCRYSRRDAAGRSSRPAERAAAGDLNGSLRKMEVDEADDVRELLTYAPDTAGGMMTTEFVALPADLTVEADLCAAA